MNLSLGGGPPDPVIREAIEHARRHGALVLAAAGNESRSPVSFPASDSLALAVSATGREGTFPRDAVEALDVAPPRGTDRKNFIAAFSNGYLHYGAPVENYDRGGYEITECLLAPQWREIYERTVGELMGRL